MSCTLRIVLGASLLGSVLLGAGCSGDADDGDSAEAASGAGGSASDIAGGAGGSATVGASGGSAAGSGGAGTAGTTSTGATSTGATYTAERACDLFGRASCGKAAQCGLVLTQTGDLLICAQCDALSLSIIQQQCLRDAPGDKDAAAVDRCVASISAQPCAQACVDPSTNECDVFGQLASGSTRALVCDARCVQ